jgi:hypothetical protein
MPVGPLSQPTRAPSTSWPFTSRSQQEYLTNIIFVSPDNLNGIYTWKIFIFIFPGFFCWNKWIHITFLNKGELILSCRMPHGWIPKHTFPWTWEWLEFNLSERKWLNYVYFPYPLSLILRKAKGPPKHYLRMLCVAHCYRRVRVAKLTIIVRNET